LRLVEREAVMEVEAVMAGAVETRVADTAVGSAADAARRTASQAARTEKVVVAIAR
jgi:hypothetical protein